MSRKLRILWCGEASYLNTGYAVYAKEVLSRLYDTDKYEIAELGCYSSIDNPQRFDVPWRLYSNLPSNAQEQQVYKSNLNETQFGGWRFEDACLDFKPDVVLDIRDWWMMSYQEQSPFRPFYKWVIMPTVDSSPQQEQYLSTYMGADAVFTYSEFGKEVLELESHGQIKVVDIASPGANTDILEPVPDKNGHRQKCGFLPNINIVGTVMRNQRRKLYPNLIESFRKMLDQNPDLASNTYLYIHTSYPDMGWDIPKIIRNCNMSNHTLMTYICGSCSHFFPSFFQDARTTCPKCGALNARLPSTRVGVTLEQFKSIFNWFDLYVQYSVCEGFGMPQVEAAACGIPLITVDYSAMQSVGKNLKAPLINVPTFTWDGPTGSKRAVPDDNDLIDKIVKFLKQPKGLQLKRGMDAYLGVQRKYTWARTASIWENFLDTIEIRPWSQTWGSRPRIVQPQLSEPDVTNEEFVRWAINNVWCDKTQSNSYIGLRTLRDLNYGKSISHDQSLHYSEDSILSLENQFRAFGRKDVINQMQGLCEKRNYWERCRTNANYEPPLFVRAAKPDNKEILNVT